MIDKALLARIRKCLALASSANEHEAAAALAKARALMDEYGIDETAVAMAEVEEATARASRTVRPPRWENMLAQAVCRALEVTGFISIEGDRTFVGRGARAEVASYAFAVLFRQLKKARAEYVRTHLKRCKPGRKRARADAFCQGWSSAVLIKIAALYPEVPKDDAVGQYLTINYPNLVPASSRTANTRRTDGDLWRGFDAGREVNLHAGVGTAGKTLAIA